MCWGLAYAYRALFNTIQYPQGKEKGATPTPVTSTAATQTPTIDTAATPTPATSTAATQPATTDTAAAPTPMTSTVATQTPTTGTAATQTPVPSIAAKPEDQPVPVSVTPIRKKKSWKRRSTRLERDYEETGPSREEEEEEEECVQETETTRSLPLSELQDI